MPRLKRLPQFQLHSAVLHRSIEGKAKLALRLEPDRIEGVAGGSKVVEHVEKIPPDEMLEHEAVVQRRAPAYELAALRLAPEPGDQRAQQQLLRQTHARIRRHLERAKLDQTETAGRAIRRVELVDAQLGAVGVA